MAADDEKPAASGPTTTALAARASGDVQRAELQRVDVRPYTGPAAGVPGVVASVKIAVERAGVVKGAQLLLRVNQDGGFDCPSCAWPDPAHRSTFEFCENGAKAVAWEGDRRRVDAAFFRGTTIEALKRETDHALEAHGRLVEPLYKAKGAATYAPIAWDDAFALTARHLHTLSSPDEAAFYTSGRASNEAAFLYQLFARAWGTNNLPDCSNMCHESSGVGLSTTIGVGKGTVSLDDFGKADLILVVGQNPGTNHPRMLSALEEARRGGCEIVSINPLKEKGLERFAHPQHARGVLLGGTSIATQFVQVRVNGDVALLKGVMKRVFAAEDAAPGTVLDHAFLRAHTTGLAELRAALDAVSWDDVVAGSGVPQAEIDALAARFLKAERVIACWAMGLTQHKNAVDNIREVVNLLLLRGHVGREGAGFCPVRGHSNVQGDRTMGIWEAPTEEFLARLEQGTGVTAPRHHGVDVVHAIEAMRDGRVKVFFALGGNFLSATPDTPVVAAALAKCALTVQVSTKLNRSHLECGEEALILPCLGRTERDPAGFVTVENSMSVVSRSEGRAAPADPRLLSESAIVAGVAAATLQGRSAVPWLHLVEDYARVRALIEKSIAGFEDYEARVRAPGGFVLRNAARERTWRTRSGKAELTVVPLPKWELADDELLLMTIRSHDQFNTTVYGMDDRYRGVYGERRVVFMHADDVAARGLVAGQVVDLFSRFQGKTRAARRFVVVPYDIPRGCAAAYFPETNALVPLESRADDSRTPTSKSIVIVVRPTEPVA